MGGFQMNLKNNRVKKSDQLAKPKISFAFGAPKPGVSHKRKLPSLQIKEGKKHKPSALLGSDSDSEDEDNIVTIDSFDKRKGGAIAGNKAVNIQVTQPLVIKPATNKDWKEELKKKHTNTYIPNQEHKQKVVVKNENNLSFGLNVPGPSTTKEVPAEEVQPQFAISTEEQARQSLLKGEKIEDKGLIINILLENEIVERDISSKPEENSAEQYEEVPVEQFGAALLRGMGWKQGRKNNETNKKPVTDSRKKGAFLGIGAKAVEDDLMEDLVGKRGQKFEIPIVRRQKEHANNNGNERNARNAN